MKHRVLLVWAVCCVLITIIAFASVGVFYTGYAIDRNNKNIEQQTTANNQKWCRLLKLVVTEGRRGPFQDAITQLYSDYQCEKVEPL